ncbi:hypothetical protein J6590_102057, partial [Homalodisca vitripennis]
DMRARQSGYPRQASADPTERLLRPLWGCKYACGRRGPDCDTTTNLEVQRLCSMGDVTQSSPARPCSWPASVAYRRGGGPGGPDPPKF